MLKSSTMPQNNEKRKFKIDKNKRSTSRSEVTENERFQSSDSRILLLLREEPAKILTCIADQCGSLGSKKVTQLDDETDEVQDDEDENDESERTLFDRTGLPYKEDWTLVLINLIKRKVSVKSFTDEKLKRIVEMFRKKFRNPKLIPENDNTIPLAYYWDENDVGKWIANIGFPHLKEVFLQNAVNGRKMMGIDASTLTKMGIQHWNDIKNVAFQIRKLYGFPPPDGMRAIMRFPPHEIFLKKYRIFSGENYDLFTFRRFCKKYNLDYDELLKINLNAEIPCTVPLQISTMTGIEDKGESGSSLSGEASENLSIFDAPTVEFQVRHIHTRNQAIDKIIDDLIKGAWAKTQPTTEDILKRLLNEAHLELGFGDPKLYTKERVEFGAEVGLELLKEIQNAVDILNDINKLQKQIKMEVSTEQMEVIKQDAEKFIEELGPIAALLALNELSLEGIFRTEPDFQQFVDGVITSAENALNRNVPTAEAFVDSVLSEAKLRIMAHSDFPYMSLETVRAARNAAEGIIDELILHTVTVSKDDSKRIVEQTHYVLPVLVQTDQNEELKALWDQKLKKSHQLDYGEGDHAGKSLPFTLEKEELKDKDDDFNSNFLNTRNLSQCAKAMFYRIPMFRSLEFGEEDPISFRILISHSERPQSAPVSSYICPIPSPEKPVHKSVIRKSVSKRSNSKLIWNEIIGLKKDSIRPSTASGRIQHEIPTKKNSLTQKKILEKWNEAQLSLEIQDKDTHEDVPQSIRSLIRNTSIEITNVILKESLENVKNYLPETTAFLDPIFKNKLHTKVIATLNKGMETGGIIIGKTDEQKESEV